jgi:hypothetical protein
MTSMPRGLAVLFADQCHDFVLVVLHQLAKARQDARAPQRRGVAPCREGRAGCGDCALDIGGAGERHLANHRAGGRVVDIGDARAYGRDALVIDPQRQCRDRHE